jgi:hypothetical protein
LNAVWSDTSCFIHFFSFNIRLHPFIHLFVPSFSSCHSSNTSTFH